GPVAAVHPRSAHRARGRGCRWVPDRLAGRPGAPSPRALAVAGSPDRRQDRSRESWTDWPVTALLASQRRSASRAPGRGTGRARDTSSERIYPRRRLDPVSEGPSGNSTGGPGGSRVIADVVLYTTARLLLVVALSAAIYGAARLLGVNEFPIVVAALFALIIAMPLGIWLFSPLRRRATAALAVS